MRGIEVLLLAGFIGLIGIGVWNARQWLPQLTPKTVRSSPANGSKALNGREAKAKASPVRGKRGSRVGELPAGSDVAANELPISKTEIDLAGSGFPTRKDLPIGASGAQIRAQYGEPTARDTEIQGGRVFEHYYYFNRERTRLTKATLQSGVIVAAESTSP